MKPSCQVADKAVSTEDLERNLVKQCNEEDDDGEEEKKKKKKEAPSTGGNSTTIEVIRLEAVLAALVESKVVAIKAASSSKKSALNNILRPRSQSTAHCLRQQRLTSTSTTASSSHKENGHQTHHHHHHHHRHYNDRKRQSDSVLLASGLFSKKRHRQNHHHHHRHHHHHHHHHIRAENEGDGDVHHHMKLDEEAGCRLLQQETAFGGSALTLSPPTAGPSSSCQNGSPPHQGGNYSYDRRRHKLQIPTSCCPSPTHSIQSKILVTRCNDADYISLNMERADDEDEDDEDEELERHFNELADVEDIEVGRDSLQGAQRKRKRKKRRKKKADSDGRVRRGGGGLDPEDLPKRARWTIIATACLLLLMSVLLVGVTLRMAPVIDEMVRKETEEMVNAINREEGNEHNDTATGFAAGSSPMPLGL